MGTVFTEHEVITTTQKMVGIITTTAVLLRGATSNILNLINQ